MKLPLLNRVQEGGDRFLLTTANAAAAAASELGTAELGTAELGTLAVDRPSTSVDAGAFCATGSRHSLPPAPGPGEQYRFHFDMTRCIGCKCCVVACNEQNGNPADIFWRRVGEVEGGVYPNTQRHFLSMGCNHCLEPSCMTGCPVDAYTKDPLTGIVLHSAEACIGCQYCTWNCSYGVPQYNPERGVVGKCDMCYGRLARDQQPACVAACPEDAIRIEVVRTADWRNEYQAHANSPGMPSADDSLSTTRITLPTRLPADLSKVDLSHLRPESAHWPLIVMTLFTQLSVGAFAAIWLLQVFGTQLHRAAALVALFVAFLALAASTLHLGRPIHAMRALRMWRRSWLSREVLAFTLFAGAATAYAASLWLGLAAPFRFGLAVAPALGCFTVLLGLCGVGASARLYLVPGRPAWNSPITLVEFAATAALLGTSSACILTRASLGARHALLAAASLVALAFAAKLLRLARSGVHELRGSFQLLTTVFAGQLLLRTILFVAALALLPLAAAPLARIAMATLLIAAEFTGRYLFFVTVVPTNMASGYLAQEAA